MSNTEYIALDDLPILREAREAIRERIESTLAPGLRVASVSGVEYAGTFANIEYVVWRESLAPGDPE